MNDSDNFIINKESLKKLKKELKQKYGADENAEKRDKRPDNKGDSEWFARYIYRIAERLRLLYNRSGNRKNWKSHAVWDRTDNKQQSSGNQAKAEIKGCGLLKTKSLNISFQIV